MPWRDALFHRGEEWLKSMDLEQFLRFRRVFKVQKGVSREKRCPSVFLNPPDFEDWIAAEGLGSTRP